jgi:CheY-like chemotaxis protein
LVRAWTFVYHHLSLISEQTQSSDWEVRDMRTLIIEDNPKDVRIAARVAHTAGFEDVEAFTSLDDAIERIEQGLRGERSLPDAIILDLNLGHENGYEVLRHWRQTWVNTSMRMLVWSAPGEHNHELCALFHVDAYVSKWKGEAALQEALQQMSGANPAA